MGSSLRIPGSSLDDISRWVLLGMEQDRQAILAHIAEITAKLDGARGSSPRRRGSSRGAHRISPEGRAAIAAAQSKRWAKTRRETKKKQQRAVAPRWVGRRKKAASPTPPPQVESPEVN
jgi:hypothetical protein